jgi:hypothetical protein
MNAVLTGAMCATVEFAIPHFHTVPDDLASAMSAFRRKRMDGALEAIEHVPVASHDYFK